VKDKEIVVGITGGIASYKAAELVRLFIKAGANTKVAMTVNATRFITPLTFEALSGNPVICDMFGRKGTSIEHITWGQKADLVVIAPATANFIAKMAHGIADDFLSTMVLAATANILVCPSMNSQMLKNIAVQKNIAALKERAIAVMEPEVGELACHTEGPGRLPGLEQIVEQSWSMLSQQDLSGLRILVTAGPTVESIDPVRYITNRSTGKMGYALARAGRRRGATVTLVSGPTSLRQPFGVTFRGVKTAKEMKRVVLENGPNCDIIIKAAAVSDYRPRHCAQHKIKKGVESISLDLVKNPDILAQLGETKNKFSHILVGFAAETNDLLANAKKKLKAKNLDMIVANDVSRDDAGFEIDTNIVKIIYEDGHAEQLPIMTKDEVADLVLDRIKILWKGVTV